MNDLNSNDDQQNVPYDDDGPQNASAEDRVFDYLVSEAAGGTSPPDLTRQILLRLSTEADKPSTPVNSAAATRSDSKQSISWPTIVGVAIAIAASVLAVILYSTQDFGDRKPVIAEVDGEGLIDGGGLSASIKPALAKRDTDSKESSEDGNSAEPKTSGTPDRTKPPAGRSLIAADPKTKSGNPVVALETESPVLAPDQLDPPEITLVSKRIGDEVNQYWSQVGVTPSATRSLGETAAVLSDTLKLHLDEDALTNTQTLSEVLSRQKTSRQLARRWLSQLTAGGFSRLGTESQQLLVGELAACFQGKQRLDTLLAGWIGGDTEATPAWYLAMRSGGEDEMITRLASLTMNVDLRCIRCHDAYIESSGRLSDYHSFAALIKSGLARKNNRWMVQPANAAKKEVFYELPNGRQKLAAAKLPDSWNAAVTPITSLKQWANSLENQETFARGIVNSVWQMVHGRPLIASAVDASAAPSTDALISLQHELVDDMIDSGFDVNRLLSLIAASPVTRRSVPPALLSRSASRNEILTARETSHAFAASLPNHRGMPLAKRLQVATRGTVTSLNNKTTILAQPNAPSRERSGPETSDYAGSPIPADFPSDQDPFPAPWLASIKGRENQIAHVGYLAGHDRLPRELRETVTALSESELKDQVVLQRVWWLLQP